MHIEKNVVAGIIFKKDFYACTPNVHEKKIEIYYKRTFCEMTAIFFSHTFSKRTRVIHPSLPWHFSTENANPFLIDVKSR